jgi:hypothetical protein
MRNTREGTFISAAGSRVKGVLAPYSTKKNFQADKEKLSAIKDAYNLALFMIEV